MIFAYIFIVEITFHDDNNKINAQLNSDDEKQNKV